MKLQEFAKFNIFSDVIYVLFQKYTPYQKNTSPDDYSGTIVTYHRGFNTFLAEDYFGLGQPPVNSKRAFFDNDNDNHIWMKGKSWNAEDFSKTGSQTLDGPMTKSQLILKAHVMGLTPLYKFSQFLRDFRDDRYLMIPNRLEHNEFFRLEKIA